MGFLAFIGTSSRKQWLSFRLYRCDVVHQTFSRLVGGTSLLCKKWFHKFIGWFANCVQSSAPVHSVPFKLFPCNFMVQAPLYYVIKSFCFSGRFQVNWGILWWAQPWNDLSSGWWWWRYIGCHFMYLKMVWEYAWGRTRVTVLLRIAVYSACTLSKLIFIGSHENPFQSHTLHLHFKSPRISVACFLTSRFPLSLQRVLKNSTVQDLDCNQLSIGSINWCNTIQAVIAIVRECRARSSGNPSF